MVTIDLATLHNKLIAANAPIISVRLTKEQTIELVFTDEATAEQKIAAQAIVTHYDQAADDAIKQAQVNSIVDAMPTKADVEGAKTITELADQVAKQGELLALIAAKMGLV